ncbi:MAG: BREX-1 system phosphatase PglZ type A, partial [Aggregatilineales bacterium]
LRDEFDSVQIDDVEKIVLKNNEFGVKYRILREQRNQKFLLYHEGPQPEDKDNWLLDVLLAHDEFRTDQVSIWLGELELGPEYAEVVSAHEEFFRAGKRRELLKKIIDNHDSLDTVRVKMLAVCAGSDTRIDAVLENLLGELAYDKDDAEKLIGRCGLDDFLWGRVGQDYGYQSATAGIKDFAIELFKSCYAMGVGDDGKVNLRQEARAFFNRWKDSRTHGGAFKTLSARCADLLNIEADLGERNYRTLIDLDYFQLIDRKIVSSLVQDVDNRTITARECEEIIRKRRDGSWYDDFADLYLATGFAAEFINLLDSVDLTMSSLSDGIQRYVKTWFRIDQLYRQFTYHVRRSSQPTLMKNLSPTIENLYSNNYLLPLNDSWQKFVDDAEAWQVGGIRGQSQFFADQIVPYLNKPNKKIYVIISDALRYEVADELASLIRMEDRYEAEISPVLSVLPSYTQLGMAALLPHRQLEITAEGGSSVVYADGKSSAGTQNRNAILAQGTDGRGIALQAEDFLQMTVDKAREIARNHDVVYLYHNRIDAMGDKRDTEERVFEAVAETFEELLKLIKKLANANANNIIITADHGFIYQNNELDESDFLSATPDGHIINEDRRFVIGHELREQSSLKSFSSAQVGLSGDVEIQIPKSINRLRKRGSGSRYVHGGAALQEIVVPLIRINKKRTSDVRRVEVSIIRGVNQTITSGQLAVKLYQEEPVNEKVQARSVRVGLFTKDGNLISDIHDLTFDLADESERDRERGIRLLLTKEADLANGQSVYVRLVEREDGTSHDVEYKSVEYSLRRSFNSDFDF